MRYPLLIMAALAALSLTGCPGAVPAPNPPPGRIDVPVTGIALNDPDTQTLEIGQTLQLEFTMTPLDANTGLTWSSSATSIATVSQTGLVTPIAEGTATITVSSTADPSIYKSCQIVVIAAGSRVDMSGWRFVNVTDPAGSTVMSEGTTLSLPEFINGRMVIRNRQGTGTGTIDSNGVTDVSFAWFNTPLTGNFTLRARVLVSDPVASSTAKGATLGAYGLVDGRLPYRTNTVNLATMMVRTANGGDRLAYSRKGNGLGTSTAVRELGTVVPLSVERIYEVKRDANGISYSVYASDTDFSGSPIPLLTTTLGYYNAATPDTTLHADITASYPMYAGFTVQGANLEISNLVISDDSGVLFSTPAVAARPVLVSSVTVNGTQRYPTDTIDYQNSFAGAPATMQLTATVVPSFAANATVTWSSSNTSVVTVDQTGLVTKQGPGTAAITATANDGTGFSGSFVISLTAEAVLVSSVTVSGNANVTVGQSVKLNVDVEPVDATDKSVTWSSSNESVAMVNDSGKVSGIAAGNARITATANDAGGASGYLDVSVVESANPNKLFSWASGDAEFTLDDANASTIYGGKTLTRLGGTIAFANGGLSLNNARFAIGSASTTATTASSNVADGEFDFSTRKTRVTIAYSSISASTVFQVQVNNNTTASANSVLGTSSRLTPDLVDGAAYVFNQAGGTVSYTIDPAAFSLGAESLSGAFLLLRADGATTIVINSISVDYLLPPPTVYSFPTENWGANASALLASTATTDGTVNFVALSTPTAHTDGLYYRSPSAGNLRFRYASTDVNAINYNGASLVSITAFPEVGSLVGTGTEASLSRYVAIPLSGLGAASVKIDAVFRITTAGAYKAGLIGSDYVLLATADASATGTDYTLTWSGPKGTMDRVIIAFSREGLGSGGMDLRSITVTPQ